MKGKSRENLPRKILNFYRGQMVSYQLHKPVVTGRLMQRKHVIYQHLSHGCNVVLTELLPTFGNAGWTQGGRAVLRKGGFGRSLMAFGRLDLRLLGRFVLKSFLRAGSR